jgi:hypothetical protein
MSALILPITTQPTHTLACNPQATSPPNSNTKSLHSQTITLIQTFTMVKFSKEVVAWIEDIPDSKLEGGIQGGGKSVYKDIDYRLDNQGTYKDRNGKYWHNLQVQINRGCRHTTGAKQAPGSVAICQAPVHDPWSAARIKEELIKTVTGKVLGR